MRRVFPGVGAKREEYFQGWVQNKKSISRGGCKTRRIFPLFGFLYSYQQWGSNIYLFLSTITKFFPEIFFKIPLYKRGYVPLDSNCVES